jgi:hypothetical protein
MAAYHAQVGVRPINNPQELGGNHAFAIQQSGPPPTTDPSGALTGNSKLYADSIAERISSKNSIFNLSDDVAAAQRLQALNYLSPIANRMSNTMTPQERMNVAIATAEKQGTTFLGGMLMRTPVGAKPMEDTLLSIADDKGRPLITPDEVHAAFALSINQWVNSTGAKNVTALHTTDGDKSVVQMIGWDNKKSVLVSYVVTPDEIAKNWHDYHNQPAAIVLPDIRRRKAYVTDANKPTK